MGRYGITNGKRYEKLTGQALTCPTPAERDHKGANLSETHATDQLANVASRWPTPDANAINSGENPETWLARRKRLKAKRINGNGAGTPLGIAVSLWPTPTGQDSVASDSGSRYRDDGSASRWPTPQATEVIGTRKEYLSSTHAIRDGRTVQPTVEDGALRLMLRLAGRPGPTTPTPGPLSSPDGPSSPPRRRLNPTFVELLMGWPLGWTCTCAGEGERCSRPARLRMLGNGQVPAVAALAWRLLSAAVEADAKPR